MSTIEVATNLPNPVTIDEIGTQRPAREDLEAMQRLYTTDAVQAYQALVEDSLDKDAVESHFFRKALELHKTIADPNQRFWVARSDVAGSVGVIGMAGYNKHRGLIHSVYVSREVRGQGIGTSLMGRVLSDTAQAESRTVQVADENLQAIAFYERLGFEPTEKSKPWSLSDTATIREIELAYNVAALQAVVLPR